MGLAKIAYDGKGGAWDDLTLGCKDTMMMRHVHATNEGNEMDSPPPSEEVKVEELDKAPIDVELQDDEWTNELRKLEVLFPDHRDAIQTVRELRALHLHYSKDL